MSSPGMPAFPDAKSASIDKVLQNRILSMLEEGRWRTKGQGAATDRLDMNPSTLRCRMKKRAFGDPSEVSISPH